MYIDTQLGSTMQVRKMPLGEIFCLGWKATGKFPKNILLSIISFYSIYLHKSRCFLGNVGLSCTERDDAGITMRLG